MKEWRGWFFPDTETHLLDWMQTTNDVRYGRPTYQAHKLDAAMWHTKRHRHAIDVGANIGLWSWLLARIFTRLDAFEPVPAYADLWERNVLRGDLHRIALGESEGVVSMVCATGGSCGDTTVHNGQAGTTVGVDVPMRTLDSFGFADVDLIKCDNEGYEVFVMRGAVETIKRCRPTIIVEQKPGHGKAFGISDTAAVEWLATQGYKVAEVLSGDYVMVPA